MCVCVYIRGARQCVHMYCVRTCARMHDISVLCARARFQNLTKQTAYSVLDLLV